jgi:DNA-binding NtrC family response regulator
MKGTILLADDEREIRNSLTMVLEDEGFQCTSVSDGQEALNALEKDDYDILITDINMPRVGGMEVLDEAVKISPQTLVVLITAYASVETAVRALHKGASDYLLKPLEFDEVLVRINHLMHHKQLALENKLLRKEVDRAFDVSSMIGQSPAMKSVFEMIKRVSEANTTVLITGASGTGKELVARAIHANSDRARQPFVSVNCGAIPENLYESEFFGYKKGAFTGAAGNHDGHFKSADNGTIFLDEIGELPEHMQVKLLRVIQEKEIKPLGAETSFTVDVRILAATNKDLAQEVEKGRFRRDLYYRLNIVEIKLPTLQERKEDIPLFVDHFIQKYNAELKRAVKGVDNPAMKAMLQYEWKGQVRELENIIERAVLLCRGDFITLKDLPPMVLTSNNDANNSPENLSEALEQYERAHLLRILESSAWNRSEASRRLGVDVSTLYRKMVHLKITEPKK